ncbi:MAG: S9 family peptidase [Candidatus Rokuibacteriota bacterium]|nr:MAG: S9 family peptidase [Candidatus Rokubacteria bacterium]
MSRGWHSLSPTGYYARGVSLVINRVSRRQFVAGAVALGVARSTARSASAAPDAAGRPLIPREVLFGDPDIASARMSFDGARIAYVAPVDGVRNLWVAPLDDLRAARPVTRVTDRPIGSYFQWAFTHRHVVFFQERDGDENWRASSVDVADGTIVPLTPARGVRSYVQEVSHRFPREMLLSHNGRDNRYFDVYRVNVVTGEATLRFENHLFVGVLTDSAFDIRFARRYLKDGSVEWLERRTSAAWVSFLTVPIGDTDATRLLGVSEDGKTLYLLDSRGRDKAVFAAIDLVTRRARVLAEDPDADLQGALLETATRRPLAAGGMFDRQRWHAVDPKFSADLKALRSETPGDFHFSGITLDGRKVLAFVERDDASPEYALYHRAARRLSPLFKVRKALEGLPLRPLEPVVIPARDGLRIHGYLTRPATSSGPVPMVLAIHGGPYWRDEWGFNSTHQWLANRGYAVLSVNYRGSTGFGKAFVTAADREWGGKMHDDLIDAVKWAVAGRICDPTRVGFFGASYGGYAALIAATRTPEVFACIVDIFGIANLLTFMAAIPPYWQIWFSVWKSRLGDPDTESGRAFLWERSPLSQIDRAFRPILIFQGLEDVRVTRAESEQMVTALRRRRAPVTYVTFRDEGHGFARPENHIAFRAITEAFLAKHLGGAAEPIDRARDFKGSTVAVEVGGELVPGLPE